MIKKRCRIEPVHTFHLICGKMFNDCVRNDTNLSLGCRWSGKEGEEGFVNTGHLS